MHYYNQLVTKIGNILKPIVVTQHKIGNILSSYAPEIIQIAKIFEELPQRTQQAVMLLANEGWFIDADFALNSLLHLENKTAEEIEELLVHYYEEKIEEVEKKLINKFPERKTILTKAFYAHNEQIYELSVPVFLIQSDGICHDMTGHHYFHKRYELKQYLETNLSEQVFSDYLKPLKEKIPLSFHENDRGENFNKLNRHTILHGESTEYATKVNSLKAVSFMAYLLEFLENN
jgi:hypothetical protein